jgi:hypothetical protein
MRVATDIAESPARGTDLSPGAVPLLAYGVGRGGTGQEGRNRRRRRLLVTTVTLDSPIAAAA